MAARKRSTAAGRRAMSIAGFGASGGGGGGGGGEPPRRRIASNNARIRAFVSGAPVPSGH